MTWLSCSVAYVLGALRLPIEEGGGSSTLRDVIEIAVRLAEADTNVAHIYRNHFTFVERFLIESRDERRAPWRRAALAGAVFGLASAEPRPQADRRRLGLQHHAHAGRRRLQLNGTKYYSTGTLYAEWLMVQATAPGSRSVSVVIPTEPRGRGARRRLGRHRPARHRHRHDELHQCAASMRTR